MHGGVILYVKTSMMASQCYELMSSGFKDSIWCVLPLNGKENILIGVIYRSPNSEEDNNDKLMEMLKSIKLSNNKCLLLMGDLYFPDINFDEYTAGRNEKSTSFKFFKWTQDTFLEQHIKFNTRYRIGQSPSLLNLVFTDMEEMIKGVHELAPVGASDHVGIIWILIIENNTDNRTGKTRDYWNGDYSGLNDFWKHVDWDKELGQGTIHDAWNKLKSIYFEAVNKFVPERQHKRMRKKLPDELCTLVHERNSL